MAISQSLRSRSISLDAEVARSRSGRSGDERRVVESVDQAERLGQPLQEKAAGHVFRSGEAARRLSALPDRKIRSLLTRPLGLLGGKGWNLEKISFASSAINRRASSTEGASICLDCRRLVSFDR